MVANTISLLGNQRKSMENNLLISHQLERTEMLLSVFGFQVCSLPVSLSRTTTPSPGNAYEPCVLQKLSF